MDGLSLHPCSRDDSEARIEYVQVFRCQESASTPNHLYLSKITKLVGEYSATIDCTSFSDFQPVMLGLENVPEHGRVSMMPSEEQRTEAAGEGQ